MTNTKKRHQEIQAAAAKEINRFGGIEAIDALPQRQRLLKMRLLKVEIVAKTRCTANTARLNVIKALQRARHPFNDLDRWGGARPDTGPVPLPADQKRVPVKAVLAPGSKELAQAIAEILDLPGWGHVVDQALAKLVEGDRELKIKLAQMGIIVRGGGRDKSDFI